MSEFKTLQKIFELPGNPDHISCYFVDQQDNVKSLKLKKTTVVIRVCRMRGCSMLGLCFVSSIVSAFHKAHRVNFCVKAFLYPTVGDLFIQ